MEGNESRTKENLIGLITGGSVDVIMKYHWHQTIAPQLSYGGLLGLNMKNISAIA